VSHELRTPLTSILGSLGLLAAGSAGELSPQARTLLNIANSNCERLAGLISDMLDTQRIESGNMHFDVVIQRMLPLIGQAINAAQAQAAQFEVKIDFPMDALDAYVSVNADRIRRVIVSLLTNAVKFSPPGATVEVRFTRLPGGRVRLSVADNGDGIPQEFKGRIFQKFSQADSSDTRQRGGTGLGLSIAKSIIKMHRGHIDFRSECDKKTEFYFDLPLAAVPCVLHIGHDPDMALALTALLAPERTVVHANTQAVAFRKLKKKHFDLIVLDFNLPAGDTIALLETISSIKARPMVIFSGHADGGIDVDQLQAALVKSGTGRVRKCSWNPAM
jgi:CheY-like chemotaxis protein